MITVWKNCRAKKKLVSGENGGGYSCGAGLHSKEASMV